MKRILAGAMLAATAVSAQAADLAVKASYTKAPYLAVYNWTGFYIGGNAGIGLGRDRAGHNIPGAGNFDSIYLQPQGGFGGGQVGYNRQMDSLLGPMVLGVEADIQGGDLGDNRNSLSGFGFNATYNQKLDWFGTVRGRVGLATGTVLTYVTGGYAYGSVKTGITETQVFGLNPVSSIATSRTQGGWTVGSGVEAVLDGNWSGKIEYLYVNLGNKTDAFALGGLPQTLNTEIRENIFRAGLNYRIGAIAPYAPVIAANWTGWYVGGNIGSGTGRDRSSLALPAFLIAPEQFNLAPDGITGGVQAGYNWQSANWVYGLEADIQGSSQRDNKTCVLGCAIGAFTAAYDAKLPWFGTVRGRLGYSVGQTLFYATGGFAYGGIKTTIASTIAGTPTALSRTKGGWTAGAGIETPFRLLGLFGPAWTTKTEYLYVDLGTATDTFVATGGTTAVSTTSVKEHIFRTGLNYRLNAPVIVKY